jgi:type III restriction enzyme
MKLQFDANLDYQLDAIAAVGDLFRGQESSRAEFTVSPKQASFGFHQGSLGIGNKLWLLEDELLANLNAVQLRHGLPRSESIGASPDFTVEMETGTGKTYVYLRTIFELHQRYGFTKFIVVVPSVAIREGVHKTLQITEDHFRSLYLTNASYFVYDSANLGEVRSFAVSAAIQIMVVTVGAINKKDVNNLYKESEKISGQTPIELIRATRPIVIVDEPQKVDGGLEGRGRDALAAMQPLCTLRYSATHRDIHHPVYRLGAVEAYQRGLVKQIEVAAATLQSGFNKPRVKLLSISSRRSGVSAKLELDVETKTGIATKAVTVYGGEDLREQAGREIYRDCRIGEIIATPGQERLELFAPGEQRWLTPGETFGGPDTAALQRQLIRRTIREHLEKERRLAPQGFKVLTLFFIDRVEKYRRYDAGGDRLPGEYAVMFEEEYQRLAHVSPEAAAAAHGGYFSIDRSTRREKDTSGETKADDDTYALIMRDKERLLSLDEPLKFIFSHSALREGWDNPNVFQICTLREMGSEMDRRQTIGRGLRLAVNQQGERVRGAAVNTLTVVATESFEQFAARLQNEIAEAGTHFATLENHVFAGVEVPGLAGAAVPLGYDGSKNLWDFFHDKGYVSASGHIQQPLRTALSAGTLDLPPALAPAAAQIETILRGFTGAIEIKNADERKTVRPREAILDSADFKALWDRIKHKTTYRVSFDNEALIRRCRDALAAAPSVPQARLTWTMAGIIIDDSGVSTKGATSEASVPLQEADIALPDILTQLQDRTQLTRRSLARILTESGRLDGFLRNPAEFIRTAAEAINRTKRTFIVDGIKYQRRAAGDYYSQELFREKELIGYLKSMLPSKRSLFEDVIYQSEVEARFADQLEKNEAVKVYAKLPNWFQIATPLGAYNPDWAVLIERDGEERLYFVVETKGSAFAEDLRETELAKINCGKAHFAALAATGETNPARFLVATDLTALLAER